LHLVEFFFMNCTMMHGSTNVMLRVQYTCGRIYCIILYVLCGQIFGYIFWIIKK